MPKDKVKYGSAYIPETKNKETARRGNPKSSGRLEEIEEAIKALQDILTKNNRDNLDAMYNIDTDNLSSSLRRLLASYDDGITQANASIETWANAQEAGFSAIAQWQNGISASLAEIEGKADANSAELYLLTRWQNEAEQSIAAVQLAADQNSARITSLASWQSEFEDDIDGFASTLAYIEQTADENGAAISQIVQAVGDDGEVTAASIVAAVNDAGSSVKIEADRIRMTGTTTFLTEEDVGDDGSTEIAGNRISLKLDGSEDDGYTDLESDNGLEFLYVTSSGTERTMGRIYTTVEDETTEINSRYALNIFCGNFRNENGDRVYPVIKLYSQSRVSVEGEDGVFMWADTYGFITLDAGDNTRIRANRSHSDLYNDVYSGYCFCTDGIYYNGELMIATP